MKTKIFAITTAAVFFAAGSSNAGAQQAVGDCATAQADIAHLEHEKKSTAERIAKGVTSIMPIGLIANTLAGTEQENQAIASGEYNDKIDARIAEIKQNCGIE